MPFEHLHSDSVQIREVWRDNLQSEFDLIDRLVVDFPYIALDTKFPGSIHKSKNASVYEELVRNVNETKVIQVGFTFSDGNGNLPRCGTDKYCVWQFNFEFNPDMDRMEPKAIELLAKHGMKFEEHTKNGIDARKFSELLVPCGAVMNDEVVWLTFMGRADFGYLFRVLTSKKLPETEEEFYTNMNTFFPNFYDVKYMADFYEGLDDLANLFEVKGVGSSPQAASDSLVISLVFTTLKQSLDVSDSELINKYAGVLSGLERRGRSSGSVGGTSSEQGSGASCC